MPGHRRHRPDRQRLVIGRRARCRRVGRSGLHGQYAGPPVRRLSGTPARTRPVDLLRRRPHRGGVGRRDRRLDRRASRLANGLLFAIAISQVGAEVRGATAAILLTTVHLLGDFISWPLVGWVSTALTNGRLTVLTDVAARLGANPAHSLTIALVAVSLPVCLLAAAFYFTASRIQENA